MNNFKEYLMFPAIHLNFVVLLLLLKIVDFEKNLAVKFSLKLGIILAFQNEKEVN